MKRLSREDVAEALAGMTNQEVRQVLEESYTRKGMQASEAGHYGMLAEREAKVQALDEIVTSALQCNRGAFVRRSQACPLLRQALQHSDHLGWEGVLALAAYLASDSLKNLQDTVARVTRPPRPHPAEIRTQLERGEVVVPVVDRHLADALSYAATAPAPGSTPCPNCGVVARTYGEHEGPGGGRQVVCLGCGLGCINGA